MGGNLPLRGGKNRTILCSPVILVPVDDSVYGQFPRGIGCACRRTHSFSHIRRFICDVADLLYINGVYIHFLGGCSYDLDPLAAEGTQRVLE